MYIYRDNEMDLYIYHHICYRMYEICTFRDNEMDICIYHYICYRMYEYVHLGIMKWMYVYGSSSHLICLYLLFL